MKENISCVFTDCLFFFMYWVYNTTGCVLLGIECSAVEQLKVHMLEQLV